VKERQKSEDSPPQVSTFRYLLSFYLFPFLNRHDSIARAKYPNQEKELLMYEQNEKPKQGRTITVSPYRKSGNGAVGSGRQQNSGKRGVVTQKSDDGTSLVVIKTEAPTFRELSKKLHGLGVPNHVSINKNGETHY
jgi:hypothetical protein